MNNVCCSKSYIKNYLIINSSNVKKNSIEQSWSYVYNDGKIVEITKCDFSSLEKEYEYNKVFRNFGIYDVNEFFNKVLEFYNSLTEILGKNSIQCELQLIIHDLSRKMILHDLNLEELYRIMRYELYIVCNYNNSSSYLFYDGFLSEFTSKKISKITKELKKYFDFFDKHKMESESMLEGEYDCILSPVFTSLISHEILGHTFENKICYLDNFPYNSKLNFEDYAVGNKELPVPLFYDDYGNDMLDINLIRNGIVNCSLDSGDKPNIGTIRVGYPNKKGMVRMRNTAILAGNSNINEMLSNVKNGIYLITPGVGVADKNGNFEIQSLNAMLIKNGAIHKCIGSNFVVSSNMGSFVKSISLIGNKVEWFSGTCFKKNEEILLGMGGPHLKCRLTVKDRPILLKGRK